MKRLMVCGSRSIKVLPSEFKTCLDKAMEMRLEILIGDAEGVDKAVQNYLARFDYRSVTIYASSKGLRNNVGNWLVKTVKGTYRDRDKYMSQDANWLLALWDGNSRGTGENIKRFSANKCRIFYGGINIFSGTKGLGGALTNPTELAYRKRSIKNHYPIVFRDCNYPDSETAYLELKAGDDSDYDLMVKLLTVKLKQYPVLVKNISDRGGVKWLSQCRHQVYGNHPRWEGIGTDSGFIRCLIKAYQNLI